MFFSGTLRIDESGDGERLDRALKAAMPDSGLRLRRRLCEEGRVLVDGRARRPGYKVKSGQTVEVGAVWTMAKADEMGLKVVKSGGGFAAVDKPGGVHSAAISGKSGPCVESVLGELFPDDEPVLLNRLDYLTSGLLLVALTLVTYRIGESGAGGLDVSLMVLALALVKGWLVGDYFMGLRRVRGPWRWPVVVWLLLPGTLIATAFVLAP